MSTPDDTVRGVKTLGIRLTPEIHAQLSFIAGLRPGKGTITDEIQTAIAEHIVRARGDEELKGRADAAREEIEREAAARQQAIATLFAADPAAPPTGGTTRGGRRTQKAGDAEPGS